MFKQVMIGVTALALLATPALAQRYVPEAGSGNLVHGPGGRPVTASSPPYIGQRSGEAYNYSPRYRYHRHHRHYRHHRRHY